MDPVSRTLPADLAHRPSSRRGLCAPPACVVAIKYTLHGLLLSLRCSTAPLRALALALGARCSPLELARHSVATTESSRRSALA